MVRFAQDALFVLGRETTATRALDEFRRRKSLAISDRGHNHGMFGPRPSRVNSRQAIVSTSLARRVVSRTKPAIGHLHHPRFGVGGRGARLLLRLVFFRWLGRRCAFLAAVRPLLLFPKGPLLATPRPVLLQLSQHSRDIESFRDSVFAILSRPQARRRLPSACRARVGSRFPAKALKRVGRFRVTFLQRRMFSETTPLPQAHAPGHRPAPHDLGSPRPPPPTP